MLQYELNPNLTLSDYDRWQSCRTWFFRTLCSSVARRRIWQIMEMNICNITTLPFKTPPINMHRLKVHICNNKVLYSGTPEQYSSRIITFLAPLSHKAETFLTRALILQLSDLRRSLTLRDMYRGYCWYCIVNDPRIIYHFSSYHIEE